MANDGFWRTVRVFICSSFRDMQAERDYLARFVFPQLREKLLPQRIRLVDVDLRWGVTDEQDATSACRQIIDECRPYFLCMIGGRFGTIPRAATRSIMADEVHYAVLDREPGRRGHSFFYFRGATTTAAMEESRPGEFTEAPGSGPAQQLECLKQRIEAEGLQPFTYEARWDADEQRLTDLSAFGERVQSDLLRSIESEFVSSPGDPLDEFAEENAAMEAFAEERTEGFVLGDREGLLADLSAHCQSTGADTCLCLAGASGTGKSALLAHLIRELASTNSTPPVAGPLSPVVIPHFVGASAGSTDARRTLRRLCHELQVVAGTTREIPDAEASLRTAFVEILAEASARRRVIVIVDGFDQFDGETGGARLAWLCDAIPENARLILSIRIGTALETLRRRPRAPRSMDVAALSRTDAGALVDAFLGRYHKALTVEHRAALLAKPDAGKPLYLRVALEELRTLGTHEAIGRRIAELPGETQPLFDWILARLENDAALHGSTEKAALLVRKALGLLGASRHGLSQQELVALVAPGDAEGRLAALLRLLRPNLMWRGELIDFFHGELRDAVGRRYLADEGARRAAHVALATFFCQGGDWEASLESRRAHSGVPIVRTLEELPWHRVQAGDWPEVEALLTAPAFIEAKVAAGLVQSLISDLSGAEDAAWATGEEAGLVHQFRLLATCVAAVAKKLAEDPSSAVAQLVLELSHRGGSPAGLLGQRLRERMGRRRWLEHVGDAGPRPAICRAETAQRELQLHSVTFSEDGEALLYSSVAGRLHRWCWGRPEHSSATLSAPHHALWRYGGQVARGRFLLGDEQEVWILRTDDLWRDDLSGSMWQRLYRAPAGSRISNIAPFPSSGLAAIAEVSSSTASLRIYDVNTDSVSNQWFVPLPEPGDIINHVAFASRGPGKAIAFGTGQLLFHTGVQVMAHPGAAYHCAFISDDKLVASCGADATCAFWDTRGRLVRRIDLAHGAAECLAYSPATRGLFIGHRNGFISHLRLDDDQTEPVGPRTFFPGVHNWVLSLSLSPPGDLMAVAGRAGGLRVFGTYSLGHDAGGLEDPSVRSSLAAPLSRVQVRSDGAGCFFMDNQFHLSSSLPTRHTSHLPLRCHCFCADPSRGVLYAALSGEIRVLEPATGRPLQVHAVPIAAPLAMVSSADGSRLAVLEPRRLLVFHVTADSLQEQAVVSLDSHLSDNMRLRNWLPLAFCRGDTAVALPIECPETISCSHSLNITTPSLSHELVAVDTASGRIERICVYEGFCTSLAHLPQRRALLVGVGDHAVPWIDVDEKRSGTMMMTAPTPLLIEVDESGGRFLRTQRFDERDLGVSAVAAHEGTGRVAVAFRGGRVRVGRLDAPESWCSVALDHPAFAATFSTGGDTLFAADDGSGTAFCPHLCSLSVRDAGDLSCS